MAFFILTDQTPTISQALLAVRAGKPVKLAETTREDLIGACHDRGIEIRNGRLQLTRYTAIGDLYFGIAYRIGILEPPA